MVASVASVTGPFSSGFDSVPGQRAEFGELARQVGPHAQRVELCPDLRGGEPAHQGRCRRSPLGMPTVRSS